MILTVTATARQLGMSSLESLREISEQGLSRKKVSPSAFHLTATSLETLTQ